MAYFDLSDFFVDYLHPFSWCMGDCLGGGHLGIAFRARQPAFWYLCGFLLLLGLFLSNGACLASSSKAVQEQVAFRPSTVSGDRIGEPGNYTSGSTSAGTTPFGVGSATGSPTHTGVYFFSHGQAGSAEPRDKLVVLQLQSLQQEECPLLFYVPQQLARTGNAHHGLLRLCTRQFVMELLATGYRMGGAAASSATGSPAALAAKEKQQPLQTAGQRCGQTGGTSYGDAVEASDGTSLTAIGRQSCPGPVRRGQAHQSAEGGAVPGCYPAGRSGRGAGEGGRCGKQASHQELARPNDTAGTGTSPSPATSPGSGGADEFVAGICQQRPAGTREGFGGARTAHGASAAVGESGCREGPASAKGHPISQQGGGGGFGPRKRWGRLDWPGIARRWSDTSGTEKAAYDAGAAQAANAGRRCQWHSQAQIARRGGCHWQRCRLPWWYCAVGWVSCHSAAAPQLGCTSGPYGSLLPALYGDSKLREQPHTMTTSGEAFALQVHNACLATQHSVRLRRDYKSPYIASLIAGIWQLQVSQQDSSFLPGSAVMFPTRFRSEWEALGDEDAHDDVDELKRDKIDASSPLLCAALHGQFERVEPVAVGAAVSLAPSSLAAVDGTICVNEQVSGEQPQDRVYSVHSAFAACNSRQSPSDQVRAMVAASWAPPFLSMGDSIVDTLPVKGGSCRSFPGASCLRKHAHRPCRTVRFDFAVSFWFPAPEQIELMQSKPAFGCLAGPASHPSQLHEGCTWPHVLFHNIAQFLPRLGMLDFAGLRIFLKVTRSHQASPTSVHGMMLKFVIRIPGTLGPQRLPWHVWLSMLGFARLPLSAWDSPAVTCGSGCWPSLWASSCQRSTSWRFPGGTRS